VPRISDYLFPSFPPLDPRTARWLASSLNAPDLSPPLFGTNPRRIGLPPKGDPDMSNRFDPASQAHEDILKAIDSAARLIAGSIAQGFAAYAKANGLEPVTAQNAPAVPVAAVSIPPRPAPAHPAPNSTTLSTGSVSLSSATLASSTLAVPNPFTMPTEPAALAPAH
jgi:hypothetical protein